MGSSHAIVLSFSTHLSSSSRAGRSNGCVPPLQMRGALRWCLAALHSRNNKTKYTVAAGPFRVELQRAIRSNRVVDLMELTGACLDFANDGRPVRSIRGPMLAGERASRTHGIQGAMPAASTESPSVARLKPLAYAFVSTM